MFKLTIYNKILLNNNLPKKVKKNAKRLTKTQKKNKQNKIAFNLQPLQNILRFS